MVARLNATLFTTFSGTNVKKWESEMQTLKNNNSRLHTALEESKHNVAQWKAQLQKYKEENDSLKKKVSIEDGTPLTCIIRTPL